MEVEKAIIHKDTEFVALDIKHFFQTFQYLLSIW